MLSLDTKPALWVSELKSPSVQFVGRWSAELFAIIGALRLKTRIVARQGTHAELRLAFWAPIGFKPRDFMTMGMNESELRGFAAF